MSLLQSNWQTPHRCISLKNKMSGDSIMHLLHNMLSDPNVSLAVELKSPERREG